MNEKINFQAVCGDDREYEDFLKDKENANQVYLHVKSEVESCMAYLLKKREEDPYRNIVDRTVYRATYGGEVPTFKL